MGSAQNTNQTMLYLKLNVYIILKITYSNNQISLVHCCVSLAEKQEAKDLLKAVTVQYKETEKSIK